MNNSYFALFIIASCFTIPLVLFKLKIFSFLDEEVKLGRVNNLDGFRFFLAGSVVIHHMDCFHNYINSGKWGPTNHYLWLMGKYGVAFFFMITAFLFWGKVRKSENIDWIDIFGGRFLRIAPLAIFSSAVASLAVIYYSFMQGGFYLRLDKLLPWFDASIFDSKSDFTNLKNAWIALAGVTWSLRWEWIFYFSLPIMFYFREKRVEFAISLYAIILFIYPLYTDKYNFILSYFCAGILCRELYDLVKIKKIHCELLLIACAVILLLSNPNVYHIQSTPILTVAFFCILSGASFFGLFSMRSAKRLGTISYSLYLMQGPVLFIAYNSLIKKGDLSTIYNTTILIGSFLILCVLSTLTYHFIEFKFMNMSSHLNKIKKRT